MATRTSNATGLWSATSTWLEGVVPIAGDTVTINNGHVVTIAANAACSVLTVEFGTLIIAQATASTHVTVTFINLTVNARGVITVNGAFEQIATGTGAASQVVTGWVSGQRGIWVSQSGVIKPWANISGHGGFSASGPFTTGDFGNVFTSTTTSATVGNGTLGNVIPSGALVYTPNIVLSVTGVFSVKGMFNTFSKCHLHINGSSIDNYSSYSFTDCVLFSATGEVYTSGEITRCVVGGGTNLMWFTGTVSVTQCFLLGIYNASYTAADSFNVASVLAPVTFTDTTIVGEWALYDYATYYGAARTMSVPSGTTFNKCSFKGILSASGILSIINGSNFIGSTRYATLFIGCGLLDFAGTVITKLIVSDSTLTTERLVGCGNTDFNPPATMTYELINSTITQSVSAGYTTAFGVNTLIYNSTIDCTNLISTYSIDLNYRFINVFGSSYASGLHYPFTISWKWATNEATSFFTNYGYNCPVGEFYTGATTGKIVCYSVRTTAARSGIINYGGSARISGFLIYLTIVNDYVEWVWPHKIIGLTSFQNVAPTITSANPSNMSLTYSINGAAYKTLTAANLSAESINATTGFDLKIRATCTTAASTNTITKIDIPCNVNKSILYPLSTVTVTLANVVVGSSYYIMKTSDSSLITSGTAGTTTVDITGIPYSANTPITIRVRKQGYIPYETGGVIGSNGSTTWVSQVADPITLV